MALAQFLILGFVMVSHMVAFYQWHKTILADANEALTIGSVCLISFIVCVSVLHYAGALSTLK
jgi:hypothetical protein